MAVIAGKVAPRFMGAFNPSTTYQFYDAVTHNNKLYFCKKSGTVGKTPTGSTDDNWFLSLDGTFSDAASLGGETASAWQTKIDNIQTTSRATLSTAGWYRVAEIEKYTTGANSNSCRFRIGNYYSSTNSESHIIQLLSVFEKREFKTVGSIEKTGNRLFTKVRYTHDSGKAYIEIYYAPSVSNPVFFGLMEGEAVFSVWKAIDFIPTSETLDGVTVTTTYDIPANASPVTDLDLAQVDGTTVLKTSILEHALTLERGVYEYYLGGSSYTGNDLPHGNYAYGNATIYKREAKYITVVLWGLNGVNDTTATNTYRDSAWTGWRINATIADLANYLPKSGGTISKGTSAPLTVENTAYETSLIKYNSKGNTPCGYLGFQGANKPIFMESDSASIRTLLHTGNKPTGTYTGNGDATERLIKSAGLGNAVLIWVSGSPDKVTLVTPAGSFAKDSNGIIGLQSFSAYVNGGNLRIASTHANLNASGVIYNYQFL